MVDLVALVEGQTEQAFVRDLLAPHLLGRGINLWPQLPGRVVRRGGIRPWHSVRGDITRILTARAGRRCTTMFDFYGMPHDWPGRADATTKSLAEKGAHVESAMLGDLIAEAGADFRQELFIPYVQVHEFEALLFADIDKLADGLAGYSMISRDLLRDRFGRVLEDAGGAEAINDNHDTCPSRRISGLVRAYRKPVFGPTIAGRIGLAALRQACPHFGQWISRLESLGMRI